MILRLILYMNMLLLSVSVEGLKEKKVLTSPDLETTTQMLMLSKHVHQVLVWVVDLDKQQKQLMDQDQDSIIKNLNVKEVFL